MEWLILYAVLYDNVCSYQTFVTNKIEYRSQTLILEDKCLVIQKWYILLKKIDVRQIMHHSIIVCFFILWYTNLSIKRWNIKQYKINYKGNLEYVKSVVFSFGSNISSGVLRCRLQNVSKETSCDFVILLNQYLKHEVYINII